MSSKVPVWFNHGGDILCIDCTYDAKLGGERLRRADVEAGVLECAYCHQIITEAHREVAR